LSPSPLLPIKGLRSEETKLLATMSKVLSALENRTLCSCHSTESQRVSSSDKSTPMPGEAIRTLTEMVTLSTPENVDGMPTIFIITPTYARPTQKVDLTSMCHTLMHVPKVMWIIIEDADQKTDLVTRFLERCRVNSVHLNARTPLKFRPKPGLEKRTWSYSRGIVQRNTGLKWLRENYKADSAYGVVYFGDDDNKYDLRLFEEMRKTKVASVFPVAFAGGLKYEGPKCVDGKAVDWHVTWDPRRKFPLDMAGFAINLRGLLEKPEVQVGLEEDGSPNPLGYLETRLLQKFVTRETVECRGSMTEIYVWHTKTVDPEYLHTGYEKKNPSDPKLEI